MIPEIFLFVNILITNKKEGFDNCEVHIISCII